MFKLRSKTNWKLFVNNFKVEEKENCSRMYMKISINMTCVLIISHFSNFMRQQVCKLKKLYEIDKFYLWMDQVKTTPNDFIYPLRSPPYPSWMIDWIFYAKKSFHYFNVRSLLNIYTFISYNNKSNVIEHFLVDGWWGCCWYSENMIFL